MKLWHPYIGFMAGLTDLDKSSVLWDRPYINQMLPPWHSYQYCNNCARLIVTVAQSLSLGKSLKDLPSRSLRGISQTYSFITAFCPFATAYLTSLKINQIPFLQTQIYLKLSVSWDCFIGWLNTDVGAEPPDLPVGKYIDCADMWRHTHCGWHHSACGILNCYVNVGSDLSSSLQLSSASWLDAVWPGASQSDTVTFPLQSVCIF